MEIIMTVGTRDLALSGSLAMPGTVRGGDPARLRAGEVKQAAGDGWQAMCQPVHPVQFRNPVAPIGTDVPVAGRTRVSAPEP
ncbi:MAG: hypothetical protein GEV09_12265 [Pseudonocardiaceae bacterium]|nr:hypothetical protein [Pseudonocardiaceae bacterium]